MDAARDGKWQSVKIKTAASAESRFIARKLPARTDGFNLKSRSSTTDGQRWTRIQNQGWPRENPARLTPQANGPRRRPRSRNRNRHVEDEDENEDEQEKFRRKTRLSQIETSAKHF